MAEGLSEHQRTTVTDSRQRGEPEQLLAPLIDTFLPALLKLASVQPGERVLILTSNGSSDSVAAACAHRVGADGVIRLTGADLGGLPESYWDIALCHLGVPSLPDPVATLRELHRLLRPVGRVALSAWGLPDRVRWLGFPLNVLARHGLGFRSPERLPVFTYGVPGSLSRTLAEAGYEDVTPERVREDAEFDSFDHYWQTLRLASPETATPLAGLGAAELEAVRIDLERIVGPYTRRDGRLALPMEALIVAAVK